MVYQYNLLRNNIKFINKYRNKNNYTKLTNYNYKAAEYALKTKVEFYVF